MRITYSTLLALVGIAVLTGAPAWAQLTSPKVGWQAQLSRLAHNVSGTVTILDENTIQVDNFTYDGAGLDVYFYLGRENTKPAFTSGLQIGPQLLGSMFSGSGPPLVIDLPAGQTLEGWNAISVWCVTVAANFGSGTFAPVAGAVPGDYNGNGAVDAADYVVWRETMGQTGSGLAADGNVNGVVESGDYEFWRARLGGTAGSVSDTAASGAVLSAMPEPATAGVFCAIAGLVMVMRRRRAESTCT
jgi:hypothetical protein